MLYDILQVLGLIGLVIIVLVTLIVWFDRGFSKEQEKDENRREKPAPRRRTGPRKRS